jgi:hypothetical protein
MSARGLPFGIIALLASSSAFAEYPPPESPQDQRCRRVAESKIFMEPNPEGLGLVEHGYRIWAKCMRQAGVKVPAKIPSNIRG